MLINEKKSESQECLNVFFLDFRSNELEELYDKMFFLSVLNRKIFIFNTENYNKRFF